jgi:DNA repair photolyase
MFKTVTKTWNVFTGCRFGCTYCWAPGLIEGRLSHSPKYKKGFEPTFHPEELRRTFKPGDFVGVALMGDISFATAWELDAIVETTRRFPQTDFLFQTKNPGSYWRLESLGLKNVYYGTTIESNLWNICSLAPAPVLRLDAMRSLKVPHKFLSIEPILDFELPGLVEWVRAIGPEIVEVGADNYHHCLPEPPWSKVEALLAELRTFVPRVVEKTGLRRLEGKG